MFKHVKAGSCIYKKCSRKLCQFEHYDEQQEEEHILDVSEEGHDDYMEVDEKQCHLCRQQFGSKDDLIDHVRVDHTDYYEGMIEIATEQ
jgi:tRNA U54 and U55 pseudouridine synthase Pus10